MIICYPARAVNVPVATTEAGAKVAAGLRAVAAACRIGQQTVATRFSRPESKPKMRTFESESHFPRIQAGAQ